MHPLVPLRLQALRAVAPCQRCSAHREAAASLAAQDQPQGIARAADFGLIAVDCESRDGAPLRLEQGRARSNKARRQDRRFKVIVGSQRGSTHEILQVAMGRYCCSNEPQRGGLRAGTSSFE